MTELRIEGLRAGVLGREILRGIDLVVRSGEVHAVMGPNGSGKSTLSHVVMGRPGYEVLGGAVTLDGADVLTMEPWQRAQAGLFLAMQYPTEVPGVSLDDMLVASFTAAGRDPDEVRARMVGEAERIGFDARFLTRPLNVDLSGGEKKRNETLQLGVLEPRIAVLDELDSGLDVDALRVVSEGVNRLRGPELGALIITHYTRILRYITPDFVHVMIGGRIVESGGAELAERLEAGGYEGYRAEPAA